MGISSTGIGSGLDVRSLVSQLVTLERKPLETLQTSATFIQTQISSFGKVKSLMSGLQTAAGALGKNTLWSQAAVSASGPGVSATASAGAAPGSYSVQVSQLATAHSLASSAFSAGTAQVGAGKLTLELGKWTPDTLNEPPGPPSFSLKEGGKPLLLEFDSASTTLEDVRNKINAAKAGFTASIVKDASGSRLTLRSDSSGESSALRVRATDLADQPLAGGLAALAYDPGSGVGGGMTQTVAAANAKAKVNGLDLVSESNTFTGAIENISVTVSAITTTATTDTPVTLTVSNDSAAQRKAVQDFVTAYNGLNSFLAEQTKYDQTTKVGGTLQADSTVLTLRNQLRNILRDPGASEGRFNFLALTSRSGDAPTDGAITLDTAALDKALAEPGKLSKLFAGNGVTGGGAITGMAKRLADFGTAIAGNQGSLTARTDGLSKKLKLNEKEQDKVEDRIARLQDKLTKQYQALDSRMAGINSLSAFITQQAAAWNSQSSG